MLQDELAHADIHCMNEVIAPLSPRRSEAWAEIYIEGVGTFAGEVVGFDPQHTVVAFADPVSIPSGRAVVLALGVDDEQGQGVSGTSIATLTHADGRCCVAIALNESIDRRTLTTSDERRRKARVPFVTRIEVMAITAKKSGDTNFRCEAYDLSTRGMGAVSHKEIKRASTVLLRFALPPHRGATAQVRASVAYSRALGADLGIQLGFEFERVSASQLLQLNTAINYLSRTAVEQ